MSNYSPSVLPQRAERTEAPRGQRGRHGGGTEGVRGGMSPLGEGTHVAPLLALPSPSPGRKMSQCPARVGGERRRTPGPAS